MVTATSLRCFGCHTDGGTAPHNWRLVSDRTPRSGQVDHASHDTASRCSKKHGPAFVVVTPRASHPLVVQHAFLELETLPAVSPRSRPSRRPYPRAATSSSRLSLSAIVASPECASRSCSTTSARISRRRTTSVGDWTAANNVESPSPSQAVHGSTQETPGGRASRCAGQRASCGEPLTPGMTPRLVGSGRTRKRRGRVPLVSGVVVVWWG